MDTSFRLGILAAVLLAPSIATADDSGWYLGFDVGSTTASEAPGGLEIANYHAMSIPYGDPALTVSSPTSLSSTSSEVEVGVWISRYVGLQVSYLDLGTYSNALYAHDPHDNICYACTSPSDDTTDFSETTTVKVRGPVLALIGRAPLPDEFELLGKVGWLDDNSTYDERVTGLQHVRSGVSYLGDFHAWDLGAGLGWRFASHWGVELWWDVYKNTKRQYESNSYAAADKWFDVRDISLGIQYRF
jgi:opacity protein-like surface antigen